MPGVGPALVRHYDRLLSPQPGMPAKVVDLIFHKPLDYIDRTIASSVRDATLGQIATLGVEVQQYHPPKGRYSPHKVIVGDETGDLALTFFDPKFSLAKYKLQIGAKRIVSGKLELYDGYRQMSGKLMVMEPDRAADLARIEAVYAQTDGLGNWHIAKLMRAALPDAPESA